MQSNFKVYVNEASVAYKTNESSVTQIQETNSVVVIAYGIALPVCYTCSNWYCRLRCWRRRHRITICNESPAKLYNLTIRIDFGCMQSRFCCFLNNNNYFEYRLDGNCLTINIPGLMPEEVFCVNYETATRFCNHDKPETLQITISGQACGSNNQMIDICRNYCFTQGVGTSNM